MTQSCAALPEDMNSSPSTPSGAHNLTAVTRAPENLMVFSGVPGHPYTWEHTYTHKYKSLLKILGFGKLLQIQNTGRITTVLNVW